MVQLTDFNERKIYYPFYVFNAALTIYNMSVRMENKLKKHRQHGAVLK